MAWFQSLSAIYELIRPAIDVALLAFLLYKGYELLEKTQALPIIKGASFLIIVYGIAWALNLTTLRWVLTNITPWLFIAVVIMFQPELRKIFMRLGQGDFFRPSTTVHIGKLDAVVTAAELLSEQKRGMLIIFPRKINIKNILETGTRINAEISSSLIVSIFMFDGPLHDGAIVIQGGKIAAAGCFLPLSERQDIRKNFGTRHRASLGMAEQSDAVVLVVSEETGAISLSYDSKLYYDLSPAEITRKLMELLDKESRKESPSPIQEQSSTQTSQQTPVQTSSQYTTMHTSPMQTTDHKERASVGEDKEVLYE
ncbi:MAG: diadenylate cyclase CdaA [Spirochaetes bacterium]|nr:diadenylate cyclase CdaA [Spirochaetota bacterium]